MRFRIHNTREGEGGVDGERDGDGDGETEDGDIENVATRRNQMFRGFFFLFGALILMLQRGIGVPAVLADYKQYCGSGSGIRCLFGPWIRNRFFRIPDLKPIFLRAY
jgi:hypothetical protein